MAAGGEQQNRLRTTGHPRDFLRPCLLLLLDESPAYGYELRERLRTLCMTTWDHGTIYRALNSMENDGWVGSKWEASTSGPQRRRYRVTDRGREVLDDWAVQLSTVRRLLTAFIERYERDSAAAEERAEPCPETEATGRVEPTRIPARMEMQAAGAREERARVAAAAAAEAAAAG